VNANALPVGGAAMEDGDGLAMVWDKDELAIAFEYIVMADDDGPCIPPPQADNISAIALTAMDTHQPTFFMFHLPMVFREVLPTPSVPAGEASVQIESSRCGGKADRAKQP